MALINSQNRNSQRRGQMVDAYGAPIFDEAQLRSLFQQIGTLDSTAGGEGGDIKRTNAIAALKTKLANDASAVVSKNDAYKVIFARGINAIKSGVFSPTVEQSGYNESWTSNYTDNTLVKNAYDEVTKVLAAAGFSADTLTAATNALTILVKYSDFTYNSTQIYVTEAIGYRLSKGRRVNNISLAADPMPKTSAVARTIGLSLFNLFNQITSVDLFEAIYPTFPNPLASDYTAKFDAYFAANYIP